MDVHHKHSASKKRQKINTPKGLWYLSLALISSTCLATPAASQEILAAIAGDLELDVRGEYKATFSDNLNLDNANKESGFVLGGSGGANLRYKSGRTQLSMDYSLDYFYYLQDGSSNFQHNLYASLDTVLIDKNLSFYGRAGIQQEFLDRTGGFSQTDAAQSDNKRTVKNYTMRGIWTNKFKDFAKYDATYEFGIVRSPADNLDDQTLTVNFSDTESHNFTAKLSAGSYFSKITWDIYGSAQRVHKSLVDEDFEEWNYQANLNFEVASYLSLSAGYGKRGNNAQTTKLTLNDYFRFYKVDFRPGPKLSVVLSREEYPEKNYDSVNLRYLITKRLTLSVQRSVDFTSNALSLAERLDQLNYEQEFGIDDGTGVPVDNSDLSFSLTDTDYESHQWQASLNWKKRRDDLFIAFDDQRRIFDSAEEDSFTWGITGGWKRQINEMTTIQTGGSYRKNITSNGIRVDEFYTANADYSHKLSRYFNLTLSYAHTRRVSSAADGDLTENALIFYLRGTY